MVSLCLHDKIRVVKKPLTLSIVIPVYNEQRHIEDCLKAIEKQTIAPDEVIVIDNNSTDKTGEIAERFSFVKLVKEKEQGLIPARNKGFKLAKGDILGRIDADSQIEPNWVEEVKKTFQDDEVMGSTGIAIANLMPKPFKGPHGTLWARLYFMWRESAHGIRLLWGANMALRKEAWQLVRPYAALKDSLVHEDQDLSYIMAGLGLKVVWNDHMRVRTDGQQYHEWPKLIEYYHRDLKTKQRHIQKGTLDNDKALMLKSWQRIWRRLITYLPQGYFFGTSYISWKIRSLFKR